MYDESEISDKIRMDSNLEKIYDSFDDRKNRTNSINTFNS